MASTINDVARQCGLSPLTVRQVLNSAVPGVSEETRQRVFDTVRALDFAVNPHTHNIGVLFMDEKTRGLTHPFFASVLNDFKNSVERMGYDITFINHNVLSGNMSYLEHCRYRNVDGVCLACVDFTTPEVGELISSDIPCVTVDHVFPGVPAVLSDNENGVRLLVEYAISMGHRRIAFISGHNNSMVTTIRIRQFHETMEAHGLAVPDGFACDGLYDDVGLTRNFVESLLKRPDRPTCILLPDDTCYFGAQEAAQSLEMRIPADISFAGYDGVALTQALRPQLTTVRQNSGAIGREAARLLVDLIENPKTAARGPIAIPVELIKGGTVGWCNDWAF